MSAWDAYLDNIHGHSLRVNDKVSEHHTDKAALIGKNGGLWTTDGHQYGLKITQAEASVIAGYMNSKDASSCRTSGIVMEGVKYMFLREVNNPQSNDPKSTEDPWTILGKKVGHGSVALTTTKSAIVIGHCPDEKQSGINTAAVGKVADYLLSVGY